jgi:hypothetical protein
MIHRGRIAGKGRTGEDDDERASAVEHGMRNFDD